MPTTPSPSRSTSKPKNGFGNTKNCFGESGTAVIPLVGEKKSKTARNGLIAPLSRRALMRSSVASVSMPRASNSRTPRPMIRSAASTSFDSASQIAVDSSPFACCRTSVKETHNGTQNESYRRNTVRLDSPAARPVLVMTNGCVNAEPLLVITRSAVPMSRSCTVPSLPVITICPPALTVIPPPRSWPLMTVESSPSTPSRKAMKSFIVGPKSSTPATAV